MAARLHLNDLRVQEPKRPESLRERLTSIGRLLPSPLHPSRIEHQ
jgi:hypothetical protein